MRDILLIRKIFIILKDIFPRIIAFNRKILFRENKPNHFIILHVEEIRIRKL